MSTGKVHIAFQREYTELFFCGFVYGYGIDRNRIIPSDIQALCTKYLNQNCTSFVYENLAKIINYHQHDTILPSVTEKDIFMILNGYHDCIPQLITELCYGLNEELNIHSLFECTLTQNLVKYLNLNKEQRQIFCDILLHKAYFIELDDLNADQMLTVLCSTISNVDTMKYIFISIDKFKQICIENQIDGQTFRSKFQTIFSQFISLNKLKIIHLTELQKWSNYSINAFAETLQIDQQVLLETCVSDLDDVIFTLNRKIQPFGAALWYYFNNTDQMMMKLILKHESTRNQVINLIKQSVPIKKIHQQSIVGTCSDDLYQCQHCHIIFKLAQNKRHRCYAGSRRKTVTTRQNSKTCLFAHTGRCLQKYQHSICPLEDNQIRILTNEDYLQSLLKDTVHFGSMGVEKRSLKLVIRDFNAQCYIMNYLEKRLGVLISSKEIEEIREDITKTAQSMECKMDDNEESDFLLHNEIMKYLNGHTKFIKHQKNGEFRERYLTIKDDRIYWKTRAEDRNQRSRSIHISKIDKVWIGKKTKALTNVAVSDIPENCCFTLKTKKATLDLSSFKKDSMQVVKFVCYIRGIKRHYKQKSNLKKVLQKDTNMNAISEKKIKSKKSVEYGYGLIRVPN